MLALTTGLSTRVLAIAIALGSTPCAAGELVVIVSNAWRHGASIELSTLRRLYLGRRTRLGGPRIRCIDFPLGSAAHDRFRKQVLRMSRDRLQAYWIEQALQGGALPPREVENFESLVASLRSDPSTIGYSLLEPETTTLPPGLSILRVVSSGETIRFGPGGTDGSQP